MSIDEIPGDDHSDDFPEDVKPIPAVTSRRSPFSTPRHVDRDVCEQVASGRPLVTLDTRMLAELRPDPYR